MSDRRIQIIIEPYADLVDEESAMGLTEQGCHELYEGLRLHVGEVVAFERMEQPSVT